MSITVLPAAPTFDNATEAVKAFRTAHAELITKDRSSRNPSTRKAIQRRTDVMASVQTYLGHNSSLAVDLRDEARLVESIQAAKGTGQGYAARAKSLGKVRGRIVRRLTASSN